MQNKGVNRNLENSGNGKTPTITDIFCILFIHLKYESTLFCKLSLWTFM